MMAHCSVLEAHSDWPYGDNWVDGCVRKIRIDQLVDEFPRFQYMETILKTQADKPFGIA